MSHNAVLPDDLKGSPFYGVIYNRLYRLDMNVLLFLVGGTGKCKSGSAITIGNDLDRQRTGEHRFNVDHIFFSPQDFLSIANETHPKGSVFIWDEIQVGHGARDFYEMKNKLVNKVLSTFRYKNYMLIMTLPTLVGTDKTARELGHFVIEMYGKDKEQPDEYAHGSLSWIHSNPKDIKGKLYFPFFRLMAKDKPPLIWNEFRVERPPLELEEAYKAKKEEFTRSEYASYAKQLNFMENYLKQSISSFSSVGEVIVELGEDMNWLPSILANNHVKVVPSLLEELLESKNIHLNQSFFKKVNAYVNAKLVRGDFDETLKPLSLKAKFDVGVAGSKSELSSLPVLPNVKGSGFRQPKKPKWADDLMGV